MRHALRCDGLRREESWPPPTGSADDLRVVALCQEAVHRGHAVLVFCDTREEAERTVKQVARALSAGTFQEQQVTAPILPPLPPLVHGSTAPGESPAALAGVAAAPADKGLGKGVVRGGQARTTPFKRYAYRDSTCAALRSGCAVHHAGLSSAERQVCGCFDPAAPV
jgi:Lhr-like helicase